MKAISIVFAFAFHASVLANSLQLDLRGAMNFVDGPLHLNKSALAYPKYSEIETRLGELALKYSSMAQLVQYGKSVDGRNLNMLRIALPISKPGLAVQISGTIHGNEYLGIEDKLAEYFLEHQDKMPGLKKYLQAGGVVYVIPIVNPDGFTRERRLNSNGSDLNRDFDLLPLNDKRFTQPESRALAEYLDKDLTANQLTLKVSLDYHCCVPALITPWTFKDAPPETADQPEIYTLAKMQQAALGYSYGNAMDTVNYLAAGTTLDYFYAKYGTLAFAIEGNWYGEDRHLAKHVEFWDNVFMDLASGH